MPPGICARDKEELNRARAELEATGGKFLRSPATSRIRSPSEYALRIRERYGRIDILVNNAGQDSVWRPLGNLTAADFEQALSVMFWGTVYPTLEVLP